MSKAVVAGREPKSEDLEAGKQYAWCACGRSKDQPFCDGSHKGTGIEPKMFSVDDAKTAALCLCKQTGNPPFCDGTHATLPEDANELEVPNADRRDGPPAPKNTSEEPFVELIHQLATEGVEAFGEHGPMAAMGVPRDQLPSWDDLQLLPAQLARKPLAEDAPVETGVVIGPNAGKPLELAIPLLVTDMSYGALSPEAKVALARGAESAGTAICSGEGGMLPEEQEACSRYLFELGSAQFGFGDGVVEKVQAFHFKAGQAAKTGVGGHLPGNKVDEKIAEVRGIEPGQTAVSPATFVDLDSPADFKRLGDGVRQKTGGIPIGFKLSAQRIEDDLAFAIEAGADYIILDGRGGGTGAAPTMLRDHIGVPLLAALPRARAWLDKNATGVTLIATGGLRSPTDFVKALALGADAIALANSAIQAIGCVGARICNTNNCPTGVATQDERLRKRLDPEQAGERLGRFFDASIHFMQMLARACGHARLADFCREDLTAWNPHAASLSGVRFGGPTSD